MNRNTIVRMSADEAREHVDRGEYRFEDHGETPNLGEDFWKDAWVSYPGPKTDLTLILDRDVVDWFQARYPKGWREHMNEVLHRHMDRETAKSETTLAETSKKVG